MSKRLAALVLSSLFVACGLLTLAPRKAFADPHTVQSKNVAVIDSLQVINQGTFPTTTSGPTGSFTDFNFYILSVANVSLASLGMGGVCGPEGCDTVLLNVASYGLWCDTNRLNAQQKADLVSFVSNGNKLIIYDSECPTQDYSWLPYPFTTSNPGAVGARGTLSIVEDNTLSSNDIANSHYIDAVMLATSTDAVGDMNVMTTFDPNWFLDMSGTNVLGVTGPVHTYAKYPSGSDYGLIIYNGLDVDYLVSGTLPNSSTPSGNLAKIWLQELQQPFNPSRLPGGLPVIGITLSPISTTLSVHQSHTVTATLTDLLANPQPGIQVTFSVDSGPNLGASGVCDVNTDCTTDANGQVRFTYLGDNGPGSDQIKACFTNQASELICSQSVSVDWIEGLPIPEGATIGPGNGDKCFGSAYQQTQAFVGQPINTRTGSMEYSFEDIAIQTAAGRLSFKRDYASTVTNVYTQTLGYGWTHTLDSRLVFPEDPGGQDGAVFFKAHTVNQYQFTINPDGTFSAYPGLCATLERFDGTPITYSLKDNAQNEYIFNEAGKLLQTLDKQGHALNYTYQEDLLTRVGDETGERYLTLSYDTQRRVSAVGDHAGRQVSFEYDPQSGDLISATDVRAAAWHWSYHYEDPIHPHFLTRVLDPEQAIVERTEYDSQGRAVRQFNGAGDLVLELIYNVDGTTTIQDGSGILQTHTYDSRHTLTASTDALQALTAKTYDANFQPLSITDPLSHTTSLAWSPDGKNLVSMTDANSNMTSFDYNAHSQLTLITNPDNTQTVFLYNTPGTTDPLSGASIDNPAWDEDLLLMEISNFIPGSSAPDANLITRYSYTTAADAPELANLIRRVESMGLATCYSYNAFGQQTGVYENCVDMDPATGSQSEDVLTAYSYDHLGRIEFVTDPNGRATRYIYLDDDERADKIIQNYDPAKVPYEDESWNLATLNVYDAAGRLTDTVQNAFDGDLDGNSLIEPAITLDFDQDGIPEYQLEIDPDQPEFNLITHTNYDAAGRVVESITNYWPGQAAYYLDLYNLSDRTFYDQAGRVAATIDHYYEADLPGWGSPESMDFDGDAEIDAILEVNPDFPELNRITLTGYDKAGRVSTTTQSAWPGQARYYKPLDSTSIYNLAAVNEYDLAGNTIKSVTNFDPDWLDTDGDGFVVSISLDPTESPISIVVDPDAPDRNQITCTSYDALNQPQYIRSACVPGQNDYLVSSDNLYNLVTYYAYDEMGRQIVGIRNLYDPDQDGVLELNSTFNFITRTYYDGLGRADYIIENFSGNINDQTIPTYDPATPDRNIITRNYYDASNCLVAVVRNYWEPTSSVDGILTQSEIEAGLPDKNLITRNYYDSRNLLTHTVENFVGDLTGPGLPTFDPAFPDRNLVTQFIYDVLGRQTEVRTDRGTDGSRISQTEYDLLGRANKRIINRVDGLFDPAEPDTDLITTSTYDLLSRPIESVDPAGQMRQNVFDALGRTEQTIIDPAGLNLGTFSTFDVAGQIVRQVNAAGEMTETDYDARGNTILSVQDPDGLNLETTTGYNLVGLAVSGIDPQGFEVQYEYDSLGRLVTVIENFIPGLADSAWPGCQNDVDGINICARYQYDEAGNRVLVTLGNDSTIAYQYDAFGRLLREIIDPYDPTANADGANIVTGYTYDSAGNRIRLNRDPGGANQKETIYSFDALAHLISINYSDATPDITLTYDSFGNRASMIDGVGSWLYEYDRLDRLISVIDPAGRVVNYTYDATGNRTSLNLSESPLSVTYQYDAAGRLDGLTDPFAGNALIDYSYDSASRVSELQLPNGILTHYTYDQTGRLSELINEREGSLSSFLYTHDPRGNRKTA